MEKKLIVMVGPAGAGKSTVAKNLSAGFQYTYISQDAQGRQHLELFEQAIVRGENVIVDRMGFTRQQRERYLSVAKDNGYTTEIIVLHESYATCLERILIRQGHETIKDAKSARSALDMFFSKYERVEDHEADTVTRIWPKGDKPVAIWSDLDGTLCNCDHRRSFVRKTSGEKKDWVGFFKAMTKDTVHIPVMETLNKFKDTHKIVYCTGRPDNYRKETDTWLKEHGAPTGSLFMRLRSDSRQDNITKEVVLDFEVLTRFKILFCLDDRDQVVKMLRKRGLTVFQVAEGDF